MRYLYLDNFRGFSKTCVPLADVNFLVGENSTGKTSLLTVLRMFSSPRLFVSTDLFGEDIKLRHFNEMVSAHSNNQRSFSLGVVEGDFPVKKDKSHATGVLITYAEDRGLPKIACLTCSIMGREVSLRYEGDRVLFKSQVVPNCGNALEMKERIPAWLEDHLGEASGFAELQLPLPIASDVPLFMVLSIASQFDTKESKSFTDFFPQMGPPVVWIAPIRTAPRRTYDEPHTSFSSEGLHTPYVIRRMLNSESEAKNFQDFISRIGKASGLFQKIEIKYFGDRKDPTCPFEVNAYLDDKAFSLGWLGYGVSQSLPIFVELLDRPKSSWFAIQQPEVHLHPRAQACLGDVFFEMAVRDDKKFLIETHSDFTIDRFRMNYRRKRSKKETEALPKGQVLFFERHAGGNTVKSIPIGPRGEMPQDQPEGYRQFFIQEQMDILDA